MFLKVAAEYESHAPITFAMMEAVKNEVRMLFWHTDPQFITSRVSAGHDLPER